MTHSTKRRLKKERAKTIEEYYKSKGKQGSISGKEAVYALVITIRMYYSLYWSQTGEGAEFSDPYWPMFSSMSTMSISAIAGLVIYKYRKERATVVLVSAVLLCGFLILLWLFAMIGEAFFSAYVAQKDDCSAPITLSYFPQYAVVSTASFGVTLYLISGAVHTLMQ